MTAKPKGKVGQTIDKSRKFTACEAGQTYIESRRYGKGDEH